jgi:hypothetical protein
MSPGRPHRWMATGAVTTRDPPHRIRLTGRLTVTHSPDQRERGRIAVSEGARAPLGLRIGAAARSNLRDGHCGRPSGTTGPPDRPRIPRRLCRRPRRHSPPNRSETRRMSTRGRRRDDRSCSRRARLSGRSRRTHPWSRTVGAGLGETPGCRRFSTSAGSGGFRRIRVQGPRPSFLVSRCSRNGSSSGGSPPSIWRPRSSSALS